MALTAPAYIMNNEDPDIEAQERNRKLVADHPGVRLPSYCLWDAHSVGDPDTWSSWWDEDDDDDTYLDEVDPDDPDIEAHARNRKLVADHPGVQLPSYCFWDAHSVGAPHTWTAWWANSRDEVE